MTGITGKPASAAAQRAEIVRRKDRKLYAHARTALRHAFTREHASVRDGAKWMAVAPSTVQRWLTGTLPISPMKVLRSKRLRRHFIGCLLLLLGKNGSARRV
jgi:hypothetical protein